MIFGTPAFDETHSDGTHFGELVDSFKPVVDALGKQLGELLVVENLQRAACRDFADGAGVKSVVVVAVPGLDENRAVGQAFSVDLPTDVVQMNTFAYMAPDQSKQISTIM